MHNKGTQLYVSMTFKWMLRSRAPSLGDTRAPVPLLSFFHVAFTGCRGPYPVEPSVPPVDGPNPTPVSKHISAHVHTRAVGPTDKTYWEGLFCRS